MATKTETTTLNASARESSTSRATRRLRREGRVPGVLYGLDKDPVSFSVDARDLRIALHGHGAVLDVTVGSSTEPAVLKDVHIHPVRGEYIHIDLLRVDLDVKITATVSIELTGGDEAPGVVSGGILDHVTREIEIEALPSDIPESISFDVSTLEIGDTVLLQALTAPAGVSFTLDETVLATVVPPTLEPTDDETETETEVVGEGGEDAEASGDDAAEESGDDAGSGDGE